VVALVLREALTLLESPLRMLVDLPFNLKRRRELK
jgi:hypothetical protein